jgi:hypothetical protein
VLYKVSSALKGRSAASLPLTSISHPPKAILEMSLAMAKAAHETKRRVPWLSERTWFLGLTTTTTWGYDSHGISSFLLIRIDLLEFVQICKTMCWFQINVYWIVLNVIDCVWSWIGLHRLVTCYHKIDLFFSILVLSCLSWGILWALWALWAQDPGPRSADRTDRRIGRIRRTDRTEGRTEGRTDRRSTGRISLLPGAMDLRLRGCLLLFQYCFQSWGFGSPPPLPSNDPTIILAWPPPPLPGPVLQSVRIRHAISHG